MRREISQNTTGGKCKEMKKVRSEVLSEVTAHNSVSSPLPLMSIDDCSVPDAASLSRPLGCMRMGRPAESTRDHRDDLASQCVSAPVI